MRNILIALALLSGTAAPGLAQRTDDRLDRRVDKLEGEMRAVQRKVFPGGAQSLLAPEIAPETNIAPPTGTPAGSAIADLTERVDALERQLATLTGQAEQNAFRVQKLEDDLAALRAANDARFDELSRGATAPPAQLAPEAPPIDTPPAAADDAPATGDPAEDAYLVGYRQWEAGRYADAQASLEAMAKKWPRHRRASYALNLAGRAYLDDGKPATAAKLLLANYQNNPQGERAADSLYFLGQALVTLKKPAEACKVYDELSETYQSTLRDWVAQRLPKARADAKCS